MLYAITDITTAITVAYEHTVLVRLILYWDQTAIVV